MLPQFDPMMLTTYNDSYAFGIPDGVLSDETTLALGGTDRRRVVGSCDGRFKALLWPPPGRKTCAGGPMTGRDAPR